MLSNKNDKIHFVVPYPMEIAPGQRFRFEQYFHCLRERGFTLKFSSFLTAAAYSSIYKEGNTIGKMAAVFMGYLKRFIELPTLLNADYVFIYREMTPLGPPVFEWILAKVLRKKIIYDFDDAIWLTDRTSESWLIRTLRWRRKVMLICKWSHCISAGNPYLCEFARHYNSRVVLNPTTIDTEKLNHLRTNSNFENKNEIIIGWTGSHSTLKYLNSIESVLQYIEKKYMHVQFCVIANRPPDLKLSRLVFKDWSLITEIEDLLYFSIGIMPLPDDEWANGKCGFKALQYMALQIPTIASPVGVNKQIITDGVNGFLCSTNEEWKTKLELLIESKDLRNSIGQAGKGQVVKHYSVVSNEENFLKLFDV
jgi:glycosyltransferase involved in cell wall biosynthesis